MSIKLGPKGLPDREDRLPRGHLSAEQLAGQAAGATAEGPSETLGALFFQYFLEKAHDRHSFERGVDRISIAVHLAASYPSDRVLGRKSHRALVSLSGL